MAYCTALQFAQVSGLGIRVVDENVGTGDGSETDFDLDNDHVVAGSYTLSYAASGSNNFTALTETTHYSLDKESGRILLTASGVTVLSTNILYATYTHIEGGINNTLIDQWITWSDAEVNEITKRNWGAPQAFSEYFDGRRTSTYPTTDNPFMSDWDAPDSLCLDKTPITGINYVYILENNKPIDYLFNYDSSLGTYTDNTDEANTGEGTAFSSFASTPASGDVLYIGCSLKFYRANFRFAVLATGSPTFTWQYYNGSWTTFTPTDNTSSFTANGEATWNVLGDWTKVAVNSQSLYWIRISISGAFTTSPTIYHLALKDVVSDSVALSAVEWESWGKISFPGYSIPDGTRNLLINYNHGYSTTPALVQELSAVHASIRALVYITGGSFDDVTSAQLGSKSVSVGEPYMNMREALNMLKMRSKELLRLLGERYDVTSSG